MTESSPDLQRMAEAVQAAYGLAMPPTVSLIRDGQGQSRIYRVDSGAATAILRVYGPQPGGSGWARRR